MEKVILINLQLMKEAGNEFRGTEETRLSLFKMHIGKAILTAIKPWFNKNPS